jgi:hypothetical protein
MGHWNSQWPMLFLLLRYECIAMVTHKVMRCEDVGLLLCKQLANRQRKFLIESVLVGLFGFVLSLFRGFEKGMIATAQSGFEVRPNAVECSGSCTRLFDVMYAVLVKDLFEVSAKACTLERFGEEITLESFIFQVVANVREALLTVLKCVDERFERENHLAVFPCICGHRDLNYLD